MGKLTVLLIRERKFRWIAFFVVILIAIEGGSSVFLFRYHSYKNSSFTPEGTATGFMAKRLLGIHTPETIVANKPEMFRPDAILGYTTNPGIYDIVETIGAKKHGYRVTITESGVRATSYRSTPAPRRIYILGNSTIWAAGLDDEMTAPWLLQTRLPNYQVVNLALTGYSAVQQLLQYRKLRSNLQPDDIIVLSYSSIDLLHNVADPTQIEALSNGYEMSLSNKESFRKVRIPYAELSDTGGLVIRYSPIVCSPDEKTKCIRGTTEPSLGGTIASKIFTEIVQDHKCHVLVAFLEGSDNDPVVSLLQSSGAPIADLRIKPGIDYDDYLPGE